MSIFEKHKVGEAGMPKAARVLKDLRCVPTFEESYGIRHPSSAYNLSLDMIARRLISSIEQLDTYSDQLKYYKQTKNENLVPDEPLLEAIDHLLDALMEHFEVCIGILKSFHSPQDKKNFEAVCKKYQREVFPYRDHIGKIVNCIKHNQGILRSVSLEWGMSSCIGYYVEGLHAGGATGPSKEIHKGNTAFSLNRDLAYHVCSVYAVSAQLANALFAVDRRLIPLPAANAERGFNSEWIMAVQLIAKLPGIFFPDELKKPIPRVFESNTKVVIEYPSSQRTVISPPPGFKIFANMRLDGVTQTLVAPYIPDPLLLNYAARRGG